MQRLTQKITIPVLGVLLAASTLLLTACEKRELYWKMPAQHTLTKPQQKEVLSLLDKAGVQVIQQGRVLQIVLPTDLFFEQQSTDIQEDYGYVLHEVALYLHTYVNQFNQRPVVRVSGYTDTVFSHKARQTLSNQYAQAVAAHLWNDGFSSQELAVVGYGSLHPIGSNLTAKGASYNRRVMIQVN